jgi:malate dehydrogenase (oxaloacetate-decarboxylating)(NADP+)
MTRKREEALRYHEQGRPGKIAVVPTKPLANQRDLALAYSPGVAEPCLAIKDAPDDAYRYTAKGNLVAVVTNGTAVLGLGNIGALAGKPVMEGKGNLFKAFADLDVFDLEVGSEDPDDVIRFCQLLEKRPQRALRADFRRDRARWPRRSRRSSRGRAPPQA